ncbi:fimbrial protein [Pluralibacter gergoviae]|uniref:Fimbrial protein n=2 Tax=Pluralibacter gergoviae TaxID=61647 RepID=A0AAI9GLM9_PLUGE|nr:fimbrial protein [Pluralibacter gergoviae]EKV0917738.1 fimbrial protein [Pluralibacter gergoviae]EKV9910162.1 fimbrial protein [Pluralibacter gergoviae]EKW6620148.1 fimbrial protein [Pluralibacter gergoviae]EKW7274316.1 fimbrial protein [Pluralibacter gergoviae]EKW9965435.1 fimbrial protein [Pluralibacter gergoviae]
MFIPVIVQQYRRLIYLCCTLLLLIICSFPLRTFAAGIRGVPTPATCEQAIGWRVYTQTSCWWQGNAQKTGINFIKNATTFTASIAEMEVQFDTSFVPQSGMWFLRTYICPANQAIRCTIANSSGHVNSLRGAYLSSAENIPQQDPDFNGASGIIPAGSSLCYTFFDATAPDVDWATPAPRTCSDGQILPETPASCVLNNGDDMDIDLGILERKSLSTGLDANDQENVIKSLSVSCTRDAGSSVSIQFRYTPVTLNGSEVISTTTDNVGVALFYEDKAMSPADTIAATFKNGTTQVKLIFQPVREGSVALKAIKTGGFSAHAVMVMTEL